MVNKMKKNKSFQKTIDQYQIAIWTTWIRDLMTSEDCELKLWKKAHGFKEEIKSQWPVIFKLRHDSLVRKTKKVFLRKNPGYSPKSLRIRVDLAPILKANGYCTYYDKILITGVTDCTFLNDGKLLNIVNAEIKTSSFATNKQECQAIIYDYLLGYLYPNSKRKSILVSIDNSGEFLIQEKIFNLTKYEDLILDAIAYLSSPKPPKPLEIELYKKPMCNWCGFINCKLRGV